MIMLCIRGVQHCATVGQVFSDAKNGRIDSADDCCDVRGIGHNVRRSS
jgi:hypothetical protein